MSNTAELCARLLEHAAIHDRETSPYSPEQAAWAADLRDAAALIQAAPVVERADSATPVVERSAGNVSDNAALAAPAVRPGWQLVPAEPTPAMQRAAVESREGRAVYKVASKAGLEALEDIAADDYRAMLAAAPTAQQEPKP